MSTDAAPTPLSKVDSAVQGLSSSPPKDEVAAPAKHRRASSTAAPGVLNINDLGMFPSSITRINRSPLIFLHQTTNLNATTEKEGTELQIAKETQKLNWRINKSPMLLEDPEKGYLKKLLTTPPVKRIDLHFPLGLEVSARNMKGVTIKDALDAIYKQYRKKADDELENPILAGFEWDKEESWTRLIVHTKKEGAPQPKKKSKKQGQEGEEL